MKPFVTVTKTDAGTFRVSWKKASQASQSRVLAGSLEFKTEVQANKMRRLLEKGVPAVRAVELALRRRKKPTIADDPKAASRYGKVGGTNRMGGLSTEERRELGKRGADARWAAKRAAEAAAKQAAEGETK